MNFVLQRVVTVLRNFSDYISINIHISVVNNVLHLSAYQAYSVPVYSMVSKCQLFPSGAIFTFFFICVPDYFVFNAHISRIVPMLQHLLSIIFKILEQSKFFYHFSRCWI